MISETERLLKIEHRESTPEEDRRSKEIINKIIAKAEPIPGVRIFSGGMEIAPVTTSTLMTGQK